MAFRPIQMSSRQFNQDTSAAKRAAQEGPVIITDRGQPAHVLLSYSDYQKLTKVPRRIGESLSSPETAEIEFETVRSQETLRPVDFG